MPLTKLDAQQFTAASEALASAFPSYQKMQYMMLAELGQNLAEFSEPKALPLVNMDVLLEAQSKGWLEDLFLAAFKNNPRNPKLRELGPILLLTGTGAPSVRLQGLVLDGNELVDVEVWRAGIEQARRGVARFQVESAKDNNIKGIATGFLVADDVLLTNCHVVEMLMQKAARNPAVQFDFVAGGEGGEIYALEGPRENWVIGSSPVLELDYALVKLPRGTGRPVIAEPKPHEFDEGDVLFIVQHPEGKPMKIGGGTMLGPHPGMERVNYSTNTQRGSSGSPVFTTSWVPVALHCAGSDDETYNMGVPLHTVHADAVKRGFWPAAKA